MGIFTKSLFILLVAVSTPLLYRQYANENTVRFMSQYYSDYKVIDKFLKQSAGQLDHARHYLPDSQQVKTTLTSSYEHLSKQLNAYISSTATKSSETVEPKKSPSSVEKPPAAKKEPNIRLTSCTENTEQVRLWHKDELIKYDGNSGESDVLLGFLGIVYNVTVNGQHYGPGAEYNVFAGKDATRAFVTGNFTHDLHDFITDIDEDAYSHIESWASFYSSSYPTVGRIEGAFFNSRGCATSELTRVYLAIDRLARKKNEQRAQDIQLPECNSEWNSDLKKSRVWCSKKSGGIARDWVGSPRIYDDGESRRCVCLNLASGQGDQTLGLYQGCDPSATECTLDQA